MPPLSLRVQVECSLLRGLDGRDLDTPLGKIPGSFQINIAYVQATAQGVVWWEVSNWLWVPNGHLVSA